MADVSWGVDFSGAADAGKKLWLARVRADGPGLVLEALFPGRDLPGSGVGRDACLAALVALIGREPGAAFGLDLPFALPATVTGGGPWAPGAIAAHPDPAAFRAWCRARTGGPEPKRHTDVVARVPFGGFNLRVYRQTYYGLRDVLAPLVAAGAVRIVPMQPPAPGRASVIEVCPASTLKAMGIYGSYKGPGLTAARARIAAALPLRDPGGLLAAAIANPGGDALDAVIAAVATARAAQAGYPIDDPIGAARAAAEGWIWF